MKWLCTIVALCSFIISFAQNNNEKAIRNTLSQQISAWNRGNIQDFMKGYWDNDSLVFVGNSGLTYGYTPTLKNYIKNYPDTAHMGKLRFELISIKQIAPEYAFVIGKFFYKEQ